MGSRQIQLVISKQRQGTQN